VGLGEFADRLPWQLSGGMQQRANLCRAIVHDPMLLMLDEPFAALDAFTKEDLWQVLQDLWLRQKFTAILVTHDLREAAYLADTVYVMSSRPGHILQRCPVPLPRPRTAEITFDAAYTDLVNELRALIAAVRSK
jgi:NitT/TauT family transport system ATP-binding protein